jgi:hypothetical protein
LLRIVYGRQKSWASLALFVIASTIATAYPWLRDQLVLDHKWIYFLSMVSRE